MNLVKEFLLLKAKVDKLYCQLIAKSSDEQDPTVPNHVKTIKQEDIDNWNNVKEEEVQITENTNFAQIGQTQKDFNKKVSDYKASSDLKNQEQDNRLSDIESENVAQNDLINGLQADLDNQVVINENQEERITNLEGINYTWSPTNRTLTLFDSNGNQLLQVSLVSLDNEGTDLRYNASTLSLELYNADNEILDSIPVSSFIGSVGTQLQLNSNQLQLKDSQGNILSTVTFEISNINGLQTALDTKLDAGKFIAISTNYISFLHGSGYFFNSPFYVNTANGYFVGLNKTNPTEYLDVNGNVKANSYKFTLPSVLTPQPNMLIAKIDGSGLMWYNNSSVGAEIPSYSSPTSGYVARWDGAKFVNGSIQDNGTNVGIGTTPTHSITLPNSASGIALYGTTDQTTNYSRLVGYWNGNKFLISNQIGGTGTLKDIAIQSGNAILNIGTASGFNGINGSGFVMERNGGNNSILTLTGSHPAGTGSLRIATNTAATGNATLKAIEASIYDTSTTTGEKLLIDLGLNSANYGLGTHSSKYKVDTQGNSVQTGNVKAIDFKGKSVKFDLQASITPTPNTLVPKTDGSGLVWYNNNSVPTNLGENIKEVGLLSAVNNNIRPELFRFIRNNIIQHSSVNDTSNPITLYTGDLNTYQYTPFEFFTHYNIVITLLNDYSSFINKDGTIVNYNSGYKLWLPSGSILKIFGGTFKIF